MKIKNLLATSIILAASVGGASAANIYAGSEYILTTSTTWDDAEAQAVLMGGHLVAINDAAEQAALIGFFEGSEHLWIGFNDIDTEGTWVWTNGDGPPWMVGDLTPYTNWSPREPNDFLSGEDAAVMNWSAPGNWNDLPRGSTARGIIELPIPTPPRDASAIPEPSGASVLFLLGAALMGFRQRR